MQGWLTSCSQPYAVQEWLTLFTKGMFGKPGGVFQPCPGDLATVHPIRAPERGDGDEWPYWPDTLRQAGKLAGHHTFSCTASHRMHLLYKTHLWLCPDAIEVSRYLLGHCCSAVGQVTPSSDMC